MISETSSLTEVAFAVCTALERAGFTAVLSGGSAATYYSADAYLSDDLDFVLVQAGQHGEEALSSLGFRRRGDFYVHPQSRFSLDFPKGPLAIGDDLVTTWNTVKRRNEVLHVLSATDSCRDRLASYLFWNDFRGLEQALLVYAAQADAIDVRAIEAWCARERQSEKFVLFAARARALGRKSKRAKRGRRKQR